MKLRIRELRSLIREMTTDDIGGPTLDWGEWSAALDDALAKAGYESLTDTPVCDFISSGSESYQQLEKIVHMMWKQGRTPQEVLSQLEDRRSFERQHGNRLFGDYAN